MIGYLIALGISLFFLAGIGFTAWVWGRYLIPAIAEFIASEARKEENR